MAYDVFISYVAEDRTFADNLIGSLAKRNISCWIDHVDILPGSDWTKKVANVIEENPGIVMVVLLSADTLKSDNVKREVMFALGEKIYRIPVLLKGIKLTASWKFCLIDAIPITAFNLDIDTVAYKICVAVKEHKNLTSDCKKSAPPIPPPTRFVDNENETMTDKFTELVWTKNANLAGYKTWENASKYVDLMNKGEGTFGYTDWQLPTIQQLYSLCRSDGTQTGLDAMLNGTNSNNWYCNGKKVDVASLLNEAGFTNVQYSHYWSFTSYASSTSVAWVVDMFGSLVSAYDKSGSFYVGPVRSGH
ncbi:MAG: DUF1566 domain-containing protein [Nitrospirae bacterium]|nr:DUF1566 domain-containing protein [Nitrospirota bacterium]